MRQTQSEPLPPSLSEAQLEAGAANTATTIITHRVFEDVAGTRWHAFAVQSSSDKSKRAALPDAFSQGWLVFESDDELRRLVPIPLKWEELPVDKLRELCQRATPSPRRTRRANGGADSNQPLRP